MQELRFKASRKQSMREHTYQMFEINIMLIYVNNFKIFEFRIWHYWLNV